MLKIIAAMSRNGVIGKDGGLIFKDSQDMKVFREVTTGHSIYMGRKTWESIGSKPLPNRDNYVFTTQKVNEGEWANPYLDIDTFKEVTEVLKADPNYDDSKKHSFIIGGGEIYKQFIDYVDEIILSVFKEDADGDTFFPEIDKNIWRCKYIKHFDNFELRVYRRKWH